MGIEHGCSVQETLAKLTQYPEDSFSEKMALWLTYKKNGVAREVVFKTQYQQNFIEILSHGLAGAPIYEHITILEREMDEEFERQWKAYLESLPMKLSLPLLLFFFPAYVILLFGPLIMQFLMEVS